MASDESDETSEDPAPGDDEDDQPPPGDLPDQLDRLWFHPSELNALRPPTAGRVATGELFGRRVQRRDWVVAALAALLGAGGAVAVLAATGSLQTNHVRSPASGLASSVSNSSKLSVADVVAATGSSIVSIHAGPADPAAVGVTSSGVAIGDQQVLTSASALGGFTHVTVNSRGHTLAASLVGVDSLTDLALVRINEGHLATAPFGSADALFPGSFVIGVGLVGDQRWSVPGIVHNTDQLLPTNQQTMIPGLVSTDVQPVPGTFGGALLSRNGEVVGILLASVPGSAMSIDWARDVADQLDSSGKAHHGWLGATAVDAGIADVGGARIVATTFGPAVNAGLVAGDVVTAIGDDRVTNAAELLTAVMQRRPGDPVTVDVRRGFLVLRVSVTLAERIGPPPATASFSAAA